MKFFKRLFCTKKFLTVADLPSDLRMALEEYQGALVGTTIVDIPTPNEVVVEDYSKKTRLLYSERAGVTSIGCMNAERSVVTYGSWSGNNGWIFTTKRTPKRDERLVEMMLPKG